MRSLFATSAIMLMVFSYIEISSGMDPRGRRKGKSIIPTDQNVVSSGMNPRGKRKGKNVIPADQNAVSLDREANPNLNLKIVPVGKDQFQLYNDKTGELVGGVYHGEPGIESEAFMQRSRSTFSEQLDVRGKLRVFDHGLIRFEGDAPYKKGSPKHEHAVAIQWKHIQDSQLAVHNNAGNTLAQRTDQHASGLTALQQYRNYKQTDGLLPEIPEPVGYGTNIQRELRRNPLITTPSLRGASALGFNRNSFNPREHNFFNQPAHSQHVSTLHQEQPFVAGFDLNFHNQGQHLWDPHDHPYANALNTGQVEFMHPNEGLPENTIFSESSHAHCLNHGSNWFDGTGHQE